MRYYIKTFGCQMNENDSLLIGSLLESSGYTICSDEKDADVIIVNTCCVRQNAENHVLGYLGSIKHLKQINPQLVIAVCGCMIQKSGVADMLLKKYRHVGIIVGTFAAALIPAYVEQYLADQKPIVNVAEDYDQPQLEAPERCIDSYRAQVNINYGCNNFCTYCIVPYVRGRERSRRPDQIIREIENLVDQGVKEIQLLGQNVNSYGKDVPEFSYDFCKLLKRIAEIDGLQRIRFMTSHPRDFGESLAETMAAEPKICNHLHLPVQSGSARILNLMNRGYTPQEYLKKIEYVRKLIPDITITTDLIVGFPGETESDFDDTLEFLKEIRFDAAYTFIYSKRSGTPAASMPGHLPEEVKKERLQQLMSVQNPISLELNRKLVGRKLDVMLEGLSKNSSKTLSARTEGNKIVVFPYRDGLKAGDLLDITITEAKTWNLLGELI